MVTSPADFINRAMADVLVAEYKGQRKTQLQLVNATGINATTMQRILVGKSDIDVTQLAAFAEVLRVPADELMRRAFAKAEAMSEASATTDDLGARRLQREAEQMSVAEIEHNAIAATVDAERREDEPDSP